MKATKLLASLAILTGLAAPVGTRVVAADPRNSNAEGGNGKLQPTASQSLGGTFTFSGHAQIPTTIGDTLRVYTRITNQGTPTPIPIDTANAEHTLVFEGFLDSVDPAAKNFSDVTVRVYTDPGPNSFANPANPATFVDGELILGGSVEGIFVLTDVFPILVDSLTWSGGTRLPELSSFYRWHFEGTRSTSGLPVGYDEAWTGGIVEPVPLLITSGPDPVLALGNALSETLTATGSSPLMWSVVAGTLPPERTLNPNGLLSGLPDTVGTFSFTIGVVDSAMNSGLSTFTQEVRRLLVFNEFAPSGLVPSGLEPIELKNMSLAPIDLTNFRLTIPGVGTEILAGIIEADTVRVDTLSTIALPNAGGTIQLFPFLDQTLLLDQVRYGTDGDAPTAPPGFTVARTDETAPPGESVPEIEQWNLAADETFGAENDNAGRSAVGSLLLMNEVFYQGGVVPLVDYIELYNPLATAIQIDEFVVHDGDASVETIDIGVVLAPGAMFVVDPRLGVPFSGNISTSELYLYLLDENGDFLRIDQLGWSGGPSPAANEVLIRVPDGNAIYDPEGSTDWVRHGGGTPPEGSDSGALRYGSPSPGVTNFTGTAGTTHVVNQDGLGTYATIGAALAGASAGTTILVDPGIYSESIQVPNGVQILGRPTPQQQVIIDGNGMDPVVTVQSAGTATLLANVVLRSDVGGVRCLDVGDSDAVFESVRFEGGGTGGGVQVSSGNPDFARCVFLDNFEVGNGGAVRVEAGTSTFTQCLFVGNQADKGGALYCGGSGAATITGCVLDLNVISGAAAGVLHARGTINVQYSVLTNSTGAAMRTEAGGTVNFSCGLAHDVLTSDVGVIIGENVWEDLPPRYCNPSELRYQYDELSALFSLSSLCGQTIGIAGPPCGVATSTSLRVPAANRLLRAAPNPFNPATMLHLELAHAARIDVEIFDARGRFVAHPLRAVALGAGPHATTWLGVDRHGRPVASGVYLARLRVNGVPAGRTQRLVLLR